MKILCWHNLSLILFNYLSLIGQHFPTNIRFLYSNYNSNFSSFSQDPSTNTTLKLSHTSSHSNPTLPKEFLNYDFFCWNFKLGVTSLVCLVAKSNEFARGFIGEEPIGRPA
jgi:hypothetical protein